MAPQDTLRNDAPVWFRPLVKPVIWGGDYIRYFKRLHHETSAQIGESWEVSGIEGDESVVDGGEDDGLTLRQLIDKRGLRSWDARCWSVMATVFLFW